MSDDLPRRSLLAAAPLEMLWGDPDRIPLAVLPCWGVADPALRVPIGAP